MNSIIQRIIVESVKWSLRLKKKGAPNDMPHQIRNFEVEFLHLLRDSVFFVLGVFSAGFGLKGFLLPNLFIDGGVTGLSIITANITGISVSVLLIVINLPFIVLGFSTISRQFAVKSIVSITMLAIVVHFMDFPVITHDKLLIAVFGGFFLGLGIGLSIRGGAVLDGTEVLAVFISRKSTLSIGDIILIFNVIIFSFGAYVFSIETALYAVLTYLAASKTVDFVVDGIEEYIGVTIISEQNEEIRLAIIEKLGRGCTLYSGKKGFAARGETLKETDIVYTLVTRLELSKLQTEIDKIDPKAFVIMHSIKDAKGGMIKKKPMK